MTRHRGLLRLRQPNRRYKVTVAELFFDLVFAFAIMQLAHFLIEHFFSLGAIEGLLLLIAVWWVWINTTWVTNWLNPDKRPVKLALMTLMLPAMIGSAAIPRAFGDRGIAIAAAYVTIQIGRTLFIIWAAKGHPRLVRNFQRILVWLCIGAVFWLAGALAGRTMRLVLWSTALSVEFLSPWVGYWVPRLGRSLTADWDIEGSHMAERCALFIILTLGEAFLVTGATFSVMEWTPVAFVTLAVSALETIAMWWLYFDVLAETGVHKITQSDDPGKFARLVYTYIHLLLVAGIIVTAVRDEFVLHAAAGNADPAARVAVLAGPALYLAGVALFKWAVDEPPIPSLTALIFVIALLPLAGRLSPVVLMTAATFVMAATAGWEIRSNRFRMATPDTDAIA
jgi:low temperature requirement protein LtrA